MTNQTKKLNKDWEKEFDKKFNKDWAEIARILLDISECKGVFIWMTKYGCLYKDELKQFIHSLLTNQKPQTKKLNKDWEKEFDKKFPKNKYHFRDEYNRPARFSKNDRNNIKQFIHSLLKAQKSKTLQEEIKRCKQAKIKTAKAGQEMCDLRFQALKKEVEEIRDTTWWPANKEEMEKGFNQVLSKVIKIIEKKLK